MAPSTDWVAWHHSYDDPASSLPRRLEVVRRRVSDALDLVPAARPRLLSLCAGDGRDVIPVLARRGGSGWTSAVLVEHDEVLAGAALDAAAAAGLDALDVRRGDAGEPTTFADVVPVDVLLLCGIFGNISTAEVDGVIALAPTLVEPGGCVIWTRGRTDPDLRPRVRKAFRAAGFEEVAYDGEAESYGVGLARRLDEAAPDRTDLPDRLFSFLR